MPINRILSLFACGLVLAAAPVNAQQVIVGQPPPRFIQLDEGDLENYLEDMARKYYRNAVDDIDVDIHRGCIEIDIDADSFAVFLSVRNFIQSMPQLAGRRTHIFYRDLEDHLERKIEFSLGNLADDVDVDVDHDDRRIEIDLELRFPGAAAQAQQTIYSMPEVAGYKVRLEIDFD